LATHKSALILHLTISPSMGHWRGTLGESTSNVVRAVPASADTGPIFLPCGTAGDRVHGKVECVHVTFCLFWTRGR
jgi:hypothetical protein